jgi:phosphoglycolate phosphatase
MMLPTAVRCVVFDLDGTLIDSRLDIAGATNHALSELDLPTLPVERVASFVGDGAAALLARAAGVKEDDPLVHELLAPFLDFYAAHPAVHTTLMPGALDALAALGPRYSLALCTNKPRRTTDAVLSALGLARHFAVVLAGGDLPLKKPDPAPLLHIAERLGLAPNELAMVGDGPQDIEAGRAAGAFTVGVRGGIIPFERLLAASPDVMLDGLAELPPLLDRGRAGG